MKKYLDLTGLNHFWEKILEIFVKKETGKGLSTNDYTTAEKTKLSKLSNYDDTSITERVSAIEADYTTSSDTLTLNCTL